MGMVYLVVALVALMFCVLALVGLESKHRVVTTVSYDIPTRQGYACKNSSRDT